MNEFSDPESEYDAPGEQRVRINPAINLLVAIGIGLLVAALVHAFRPTPKPQERLARLLEDMEDSLREVSGTALNKAGDLAADGAHALGDRLDRGEAQVGKLLRSATRRLRRMMS